VHECDTYFTNRTRCPEIRASKLFRTEGPNVVWLQPGETQNSWTLHWDGGVPTVKQFRH
jgi:hypothetical protein